MLMLGLLLEFLKSLLKSKPTSQFSTGISGFPAQDAIGQVGLGKELFRQGAVVGAIGALQQGLAPGFRKADRGRRRLGQGTGQQRRQGQDDSSADHASEAPIPSAPGCAGAPRIEQAASQIQNSRDLSLGVPSNLQGPGLPLHGTTGGSWARFYPPSPWPSITSHPRQADERSTAAGDGFTPMCFSSALHQQLVTHSVIDETQLLEAVQPSDPYLLALAVHHGGTLVSFDRRRIRPYGSQHHPEQSASH